MPDNWTKEFERRCKEVFTLEFRVGLIREKILMEAEEEKKHRLFLKEVKKIKDGKKN